MMNKTYYIIIDTASSISERFHIECQTIEFGLDRVLWNGLVVNWNLFINSPKSYIYTDNSSILLIITLI